MNHLRYAWAITRRGWTWDLTLVTAVAAVGYVLLLLDQLGLS